MVKEGEVREQKDRERWCSEWMFRKGKCKDGKQRIRNGGKGK